jgi:hypothetical protein
MPPRLEYGQAITIEQRYHSCAAKFPSAMVVVGKSNTLLHKIYLI